MGARREHGSGTIIARGADRWLLRIDYGRDPLTKKRIRRSYTVVGTKAAAQRRMRELLLERDADASLPSRLTIGEWLTRWLASHHADGRINEKVHVRYQGIVNGHIIPAIGSLELKDLRSTHIAQLKSRWLSRGNRGGEEPLSAASVYKHLVMLRRALAEAVRLGLIARNPADAVSKPSRVKQREQRALTEEEITLLLTSAAGSRYDAPIRFTLASGLRLGELLALEWADVDLDKRLVHVRGTKTAKSRRTVELSAVTVSTLRAHRQRQRRDRLRRGPVWEEHGLVFASTRGTPWFQRMFYRDYRLVVDRSGIAEPASVTWHTLRHTAATQWLRHGADVFSVSRRLGHASAAFTMDVYGHLLRGQQHQAAEALDYLLGPG